MVEVVEALAAAATEPSILVQDLRDFLGRYCADLSTSMKFGTDIDRVFIRATIFKSHRILNNSSFCRFLTSRIDIARVI